MKNPITIWQERGNKSTADLTLEQRFELLRTEMDELKRFVRHLQVEVEDIRERVM